MPEVPHKRPIVREEVDHFLRASSGMECQPPPIKRQLIRVLTDGLALVVWESFAAGGATKNQLAPPNPAAADCNALHSRRGHIAGCNNPPSGPSPVASRAGLLTNPLVHASSTLFLKGEI